MVTFFKGTALILALLVYIIIAWLLKIFLLSIFSSFYFKILSDLTKAFSRFLRLILNIKAVIEGQTNLLKEKGNFIISNHLGYLDGIILSSLFASVFVSKSEVKSWPLFGLMAQAGGTIFIERRSRIKSIGYVEKAVLMLKRKVNILIFPEGTSTNGERLFDFQTVHFQAPLDVAADILPVAINYNKVNAGKITSVNRDLVCWYGQISFFPHLLRVLKLKSIEARVRIYPKIHLDESPYSGYSRKTLGEFLHKMLVNNYPLFR